MTFKSLYSPLSHSFAHRYITQLHNLHHISYYDIMSCLLSNPSFHINQTIDYLNSSKCLFQIDHYHIQFTFSPSLHYSLELFICDIESLEVTILCGSSLYDELLEVDASTIYMNTILDLSHDGRRWEGGELNGKPFGFGHEYSENDNLVYEGFVFEGKKVCFGKEFNDDGNNNCLMYEGGYWNDKRWGKGISYDLTDNVDFEGEWLNNYVIRKDGMIYTNQDNQQSAFSISTEEVLIGGNKECDESITSLHCSPLLFSKIKRIVVAECWLPNIREFVIDGLPNLESVKIGNQYFKIDCCRERVGGVCRITNCPKLRHLEMGNYCFQDIQSFELSNVNSLQSIKFGEYCFYYADCLINGE